MDVEKIVERLSKDLRIEKERLEKEIEEIILAMDGLISKEGALKIVARNYGIDLINYERNRLFIKNLVDGLKNIEIHGIIYDIKIKKYKKNGNEKEFATLIIRDESGFIRVNVWNKKGVEKVKNFKVGDKIKVIGNCKYNEYKNEIEINVEKSIEKSNEEFGKEAYYYQKISQISEGLNIVKATLINCFNKDKYYRLLIDDGEKEIFVTSFDEIKDLWEEYIFELNVQGRSIIVRNYKKVNNELKRLLNLFSLQ